MIQDFQYLFFGFSSLICHYQNTPVDYAFGKRNEPFVLGSSNCFSKQRLLSIQLTKKCFWQATHLKQSAETAEYVDHIKWQQGRGIFSHRR